MSKRVQFIVTQLGGNVDPFMLHIYAALAEKERAMISERTKVALRAAKGRGVQLGNPNVGKMNTEAAPRLMTRSCRLSCKICGRCHIATLRRS
jgi:DNA invertase Pin-like site-specific DNA recombinase